MIQLLLEIDPHVLLQIYYINIVHRNNELIFSLFLFALSHRFELFKSMIFRRKKSSDHQTLKITIPTANCSLCERLPVLGPRQIKIKRAMINFYTVIEYQLYTIVEYNIL